MWGRIRPDHLHTRSSLMLKCSQRDHRCGLNLAEQADFVDQSALDHKFSIFPIRHSSFRLNETLKHNAGVGAVVISFRASNPKVVGSNHCPRNSHIIDFTCVNSKSPTSSRWYGMRTGNPGCDCRLAYRIRRLCGSLSLVWGKATSWACSSGGRALDF